MAVTIQTSQTPQLTQTLQALPDKDIYTELSMHYILFGIIIISTLLSIVLKYFLEMKKSIYSKLMTTISQAEAIFTFSSVWFVIPASFYDKFHDIITSTVILDFFTNSKEVLAKFNICIFYTFQSYSILLNMFICMEMVYSLKYPVTKIQKRLKMYNLFTYLVCIIQFILIIIDNKIFNVLNPDEYPTVTSRFFNTCVQTVVRLFTFIPYICFFLIGSISIFYLVVRFCRGKGFKKKERDTFVFKHVLYVLAYFLLYLPVMFNYLILIFFPDFGLILPDVNF